MRALFRPFLLPHTFLDSESRRHDFSFRSNYIVIPRPGESWDGKSDISEGNVRERALLFLPHFGINSIFYISSDIAFFLPDTFNH